MTPAHRLGQALTCAECIACQKHQFVRPSGSFMPSFIYSQNPQARLRSVPGALVPTRMHRRPVRHNEGASQMAALCVERVTTPLRQHHPLTSAAHASTQPRTTRRGAPSQHEKRLTQQGSAGIIAVHHPRLHFSCISVEYVAREPLALYGHFARFTWIERNI
jgi:hypothetical protein